MRARTRLAVAGGLALALGLAAGCTDAVIVLRTRPDCGGPSIFDGGVGEAGTRLEPPPVVPDGGPACNPWRRPDPPPGGIVDGPDGPALTFALKQLRLDQSGNAWRTIGWDLDGLCSDGTPGSADCTPVTPPVFGAVPDGERGIDNVFGNAISPALLIANPLVGDDVRAVQESGRYALLVELTGWSGMPDDSRVRVVVTQAEYVVRREEAGRGAPIACDLPRWDGTDVAYPADTSFVDGDPTMPRMRIDRAYVRGGMLVAFLPDRADFDVAGSDRVARFRLTDGTLIGRISADSMRLDDAILSGRWSIVDILEALPALGLCPGVPEHETQRTVLVQILNMSADIRSDRSTDRMGLPCDAVSFGLTLQGRRVALGGVVPAAARLQPCP